MPAMEDETEVVEEAAPAESSDSEKGVSDGVAPTGGVVGIVKSEGRVKEVLPSFSGVNSTGGGESKEDEPGECEETNRSDR